MTEEIQITEHEAARAALARRGWVRLGWDAEVAAWAAAALALGRAAVAAPENAHWLQCAGTWFVGVDCLPNDASGQVGGVAFPAALRGLLAGLGLPDLPFHPAQVSITYPGYPQPRAGDSAAAARYRRRRDAAHVDGLLPVGPHRRRMLREPHAYILGLPLSEAPPEASPLVVWEGSHQLMARALGTALAGQSCAAWPEVDLTEAYHAARRAVFAQCRRVAVAAAPGQVTLLHRLALHGVAPWPEGVGAGPDGRMIAYFRPQGALGDWI